MLEGYSEVSNLEPVRPKIEYHNNKLNKLEESGYFFKSDEADY
jgi:hypothetical protein